MAKVSHVAFGAGPPAEDSLESTPCGRFHLPWRPMPGAYRVMVQFRDYQVMLVSVAGTRQEAIERAQEWLAAHEANGRNGNGAAAASVYVEHWTDYGWEVLGRAAGGFYREVRPRQKENRPRIPRDCGALHERRRADVRRALRAGLAD